jgi:hypothetical protein
MPANISVSTPVQSVAITETSYSVSVVGDTATVSVSTNTPAVSVVDSTSTFTISTIATKTDVGLGSVDNTSDANKPISTATQTALNLKANAANPSLTGTAALAADFKFSGLRPTIQSPSGTITGLRLLPPSNTTNNLATITGFNNTDADNADFITIGARVSTTNPLRIQTGKYTSGTLGSTTNDVVFLNNTTNIGTINYTGTPTNSTDLTTKTYVDQAISSAVAAKDNTDEITEGSTNLYFTTARARGAISVSGNLSYNDGVISYNTPTTSGITEGSNLYHTTARARGSVSGGTGITYSSTNGIINVDTTTIATRAFVQAQITSGTLTNTDGLAEGTTNLYYTNARARAAVGAGTGISYNSSTGVITNTITQYTDALARGAVSVTDAGGDGSVSYNNTTGVITYTGPSSSEVRAHLSAGTGLTYATGQFAVDTSTIATRSYADGAAASAAAAVVNSAPATLDTLNELAAALGNDPNYATTITTALGNKLSTSSFNTTADGWLAGKTTTNLTEGTNLYYTDTRARGAVSAGTGISYSSGTGVITNTITQYTDALARGAISASTGISYNSSTGAISSTITQYTDALARASVSAGTGISYSSSTGVITNTITQYTDALARGAISVSGSLSYNSSTGVVSYTTPTTTGITEGTNLYYTDARVRAVVDNNVDLDVDGSNYVYVKSLRDSTRILGSLQAHTDSTYTFPPIALNSISNNNGIDASSSMGTGSSLGLGAQGQFIHYFGDTFAGTNTAPVFSFKSANGNSASSGTIPFSGVAVSAPSAVTSAVVLGGLNFNGHATTGFTDYIGTQNQGGGIGAIHAGQLQFAPAETFADSTLTISGATITAVSRVNAAQTVTSVSGTRGQLTIPSTLAGVGTAVIVTGTLTGTATGISAGTYYIVANNGGVSNSTQITLGTTPGGAPITTTAGTTTGLTFTRQLITVTYSAQTYIPFGQNAKVTISGFTNVTSGTYMLVGAATTTTASIGAPSSTTPVLSGSQSVSTPTITNGAAQFRVRSFPLATPLNSGNRLDLISHTASSATYRADTFIVSGGAYGNTSTSRFEISDSRILNNRAYRNAITTATVTEGQTYTPAATDNNSISLTINTGSGTTIIDLINLTGQSTGGMYSIMVFNNAASGTPIQVKNTRINTNNLTTHTIPQGGRIMITVYVVGDYATSEHLVVA